MLPAYMKIHDQIKKDIDEGSWKIGERLPSERDLAEEFEVSRMTLRQAISRFKYSSSGKNAWNNQFYRDCKSSR